MVGIVIVSHSHRLAQGVKELADQMTGGRVRIATAGGLDDETLGTSADRVLQAISAASGDDGVLVLMDLGSAVMTAEVAVEMLPAEMRGRVVLCPAPLVEGAVAAAVQAAAGAPLAEVEAAARKAIDLMKPVARAGEAGSASQPAVQPREQREGKATAVLVVRNEHGLHARPAAEFVRTSSKFKAAISVRNLSRGGLTANAKSIVEVLSLGVESGHSIEVSADGPDQAEAVEALRSRVESGDGGR